MSRMTSGVFLTVQPLEERAVPAFLGVGYPSPDDPDDDPGPIGPYVRPVDQFDRFRSVEEVANPEPQPWRVVEAVDARMVDLRAFEPDPVPWVEVDVDVMPQVRG